MNPTISFFIALNLLAVSILRSESSVSHEIIPQQNGVEGRADDLFQGALPTSWSPVFGVGESGRLDEVKEMFGSVVALPPSPGATIFAPSNLTPVFFVEFQTTTPVSFGTIQILFEVDRSGVSAGERAVQAVALYGRALAGDFNGETLLFESAIERDYIKSYGSERIQLNVTGLKATDLQFFRVEFVGRPSERVTSIPGPRVLEIDALEN
jgi:hypothetical protein